MNIKLHEKPDLEYDALMFLITIASNKKISDYKKSVLEQRSGINEDRLGQYLDPYIELEEKIIKKVPLDKKALLLFKDRGELINAFALSFFFGGGVPFKNDVRLQLLFNESEIIEWNKKENRLRIKLEGQVVNISNEIYESDANMFSFVNSLPLPLEDRYEMLDFYFNFGEYELLYKRLIKDTIQIIEKQLSAFEKQLKVLNEFLTKKITHKGNDFLREQSISLAADEHYNVYPCLAMPNAISLHDFFTPTDKDTPKQTVSVGITVFELRELFEEYFEEISSGGEFIKIVSDPAKIKILNLLKKGPLYAAEIAEALELSAPTISQHMNTLAQSQLVLFKKEGRRIYYQRNEKQIEQHAKSFMENI